MPLRDVSYLFERRGAWFPIKFPNSSHQYPIKILLLASSSQKNLIKFFLFSSSSQKVPIKFLLFLSITHQYPFVLIKFPNDSHQISLVPIKILLFPWLWRVGRWARRGTVRLVRDSGRVLNEASQFVGRPEGELQWQADVCRVRQSRNSGISACQVLWRADLLLAWQSAALLPECARPKRWKTLNTPHGVLFGALSGPDSAVLPHGLTVKVLK